jgi:hypothetical protein
VGNVPTTEIRTILLFGIVSVDGHPAGRSAATIATALFLDLSLRGRLVDLRAAST